MKDLKNAITKIVILGVATLLLVGFVPTAVLAAETDSDIVTAETDGDTAVSEMDGSAPYTVEFTYNGLQYVLPGDSSTELSEILDRVGLTGEVSAEEVSDESLFSADKKEGKWIVTAHRAFHTDEWMKVLIDGVEYEITVTDDQELTWSALQEQFNSASTDAENPTTITLSGDVTANEGDSTLLIPADRYVTLDLNGHTIDRGLAGKDAVVNGNVITVSGNLTLTDDNTDNPGKITGGKNTSNGDV